MKYKLTGFADEIAPELDVQLAALNHLGIKNVELRGIDGKSVAEITREEAKVVHEKLHAAGVAVSAIGSPIGKISINEDFSAHFALFQHVVALCEILETNYIRMFSFFIPTGENPEKYKGEVMNRLRQMRDYAAEKGVVLLHENEKEIYGDTAPRCLQIMQELYGPHFKAIFDFANFVQCGQNTLSAYEELKPYIAYIHIKDAKGAQVMPAGMGDGNVKEILQQLFASGYTGFLSLEPHLADFAGFSALEHQDDKKSEKTSDGKFSWQLALNALKAILFDLENSSEGLRRL